ncbi:MAG: hypothetical protein UZ17_ACD001001549 [Acidobacteria bacterium OLB17]|nr:MAG: hypothetical protein UZ17_ACD001001549 [Acidobacteria bacterium OLB17]MCZ2391353.1 DUF721 domain-containing protein [Acidobacteriota bacterium]
MEPIFSTISSVLGEVDAAPEALESLVFAAWPSAVGELVDKRTRPLRLDRKRLTVAVADKTWKVHLESLAGHILAKLNTLCGNGSVAYIGFTIDPALFENSSQPTAGSEPAEVARELHLAAERIDDANLRMAFIEAAAAYLSR